MDLLREQTRFFCKPSVETHCAGAVAGVLDDDDCIWGTVDKINTDKCEVQSSERKRNKDKMQAYLALENKYFQKCYKYIAFQNLRI